MRKLGFLKQFYSCHFSKPAGNRSLFRAVVQNETHSILEIGISSIERTVRLIEIAHRFQTEPVRYFGIDLFEAGNTNSQRVGLKMAHVALKKTGANVKLMPGDPFSCLSRSANLIEGVDLLIVAAEYDEQALSRSWFYVPRIIHEDSTIMIERTGPDGNYFESRTYADIEKLAETSFSDYPRSVARKAA